MLNDDLKILLLILLLGFNTFIGGYILGKFRSNSGVSNNDRPQSFFKDNKKANTKNIQIDDKKFVGDINTDNIEKKYDSLGDTKQSSENISGAISKLKNIKS
jgi:hypothetical protein